MGIIDSKTFKSGNSVAVRLPKELGFPAGIDVTLERIGDTVTIRPTFDAAEEKRKVHALVDALQALGPPITPVGKREPIEFPDRPGLY